MIKYENRCVSCHAEGYPCWGSYCPLIRYKIYICDKCNKEVEGLVEVEGDYLCVDCAKETIEENE